MWIDILALLGVYFSVREWSRFCDTLRKKHGPNIWTGR